ncbi:MAG: hypothetical protein WC812_00910 [Candidatus Pacearchaeota archaeon]|jgi:hypothetical protein
MKQLSLFNQKELNKIISDSALAKKVILGEDEYNILNFYLEDALMYFAKKPQLGYMLTKSILQYWNKQNKTEYDIMHNEIIIMYESIKKNLKKMGGINKKNLNKWRKANHLDSFGTKQYSLLRNYSENILEMTKDQRRNAQHCRRDQKIKI